MLQGGISTVTAVTKNESSDKNETNNISASFGLSEALSSLFKIGLSAEIEANGKEQASHSIQEERVHTPASLFYQLRNTLLDKKYLHQLAAGSTIKSGDIVEFTAKLKRNPIVETMDTLNEIMAMAMAFEEKPTSGGRNQKNPAQSESFKIKNRWKRSRKV